MEGTMEQVFINANFRYVSIIPVSNGVRWSVHQMCEQIATFYKARNFHGDRIVVWIDREGRAEECEEIETAIRERLIAEGAPADQLALLICDRMTENLMLSDSQVISDHFGLEYTYCGDGHGGKGLNKQLYKDAGENYKETLHGVTLLKKIRLKRCAENSDFVKRFANALNLPCWWHDQGVTDQNNDDAAP